MRMRLFAALALAAACIAVLIRLDLHSDDTGVLVFLILTTAFLLTAVCPRRPWAWALLLASSLTVAEVYNFYYGAPRPGLQTVLSIAPIGLFITAVSLLGAYAAVLLRWLISES